MKLFTPLAGIFGLALLTGLVAYFGFASVAEAIVSSRWGTALVILARAIALAAAGIGWWFLLPPPRSAPYICVGLRFVRDGINTLFPVGGVGGDIVGARLLTRFGIAMNLALASVLIDIFMQVVCLLILVLVGLWVVFDLIDAHHLTTITSIMVAVALPAVGGFYLTLNFGAFEPLVRRIVNFGEQRHWAAFNHVADLGDRLQQIWRNHRALSVSFLIHLATVFFGATEVWIVLSFTSHPVGVAAAVAIEGLGQGSRAAAFLLPGGLGVQDGALIAACAIFGVPAEVALAMALIKRVPDVVLGVPALLSWQTLEGKRLLSLGK